MRLRAPATAVLTAALALSALPAVTAAPEAGTLQWGACDSAQLAKGGFECASLVVPELRTKPDGATVTLALVRHRSTGTEAERIGSLVFNPGGPGGTGLDAILGVWPLLPDAAKQRFDLVSWDPRGVGASSDPLPAEHCATPYPVRPLTGPVDWAQVVRRFERDLARANAECQESFDGDIRSISTMQNVSDLEAIRAALGEEQLSYWGLSYGTRIGYVYALRYPTRIRAMVLDGSIDPASTYFSLTEGGAAPDQAYGSFADAYPAAARGLDELLEYLDRRTVSLPDGQRLDRWIVLDTIYGNIAQQAAYRGLAGVIGVWHRAVFGTGAVRDQARAAAAASMPDLRDVPNSNAGRAFSVTNCADYADRTSTAKVIAAVRDQRRLAPRYGASLATMYGLGCAGLTFRPDPIPRITNQGSAVPVLILGASRDGSTIVQWTARMSRAFPNSRTVTYAGGQHVTWGFAGSDCVDAVANAYVVDGTLPAMDVGCPNVVKPAQR